jgi:signal transduction histidine kinase
LDAGLIRLASQPVDLVSLIKEVVEQTDEASDRDVHLVLRSDGHAAMTSGDAARLRKAFDAVFRCVLREKPGPVTVAADCRRGKVDGVDCLLVVVADESSIDQALARARRPFIESRGGMGLALPLARRIIEGHHGRLEAPEPAPGRTETDDPLARSSAIVTIPLTLG